MKDNLEQKFKEIQGAFDVEEPAIGHFNRFEAKLARHTETDKIAKWNPKTWRWLSVAASVVLLIGLWLAMPKNQDQGMQLAEVSPEMEETQSFFTSVIQSELEKINLERTPENEEIINSSLKHIEKLEEEYKQLTLDLKDTSNDKRIIYAMIANYQQRIEVLENLLEQLDEIKQMQSSVNQA